MKTIKEVTKQYMDLMGLLALPEMEVEDVVVLLEPGVMDYIHAMNQIVLNGITYVVRDYRNTLNLFDKITQEHAKTQSDLMIMMFNYDDMKKQRDVTVEQRGHFKTQFDRLVEEKQALKEEILNRQKIIDDLTAQITSLKSKMPKKIKSDVKPVKIKRTVENGTMVYFEGKSSTFYDLANSNHMSDSQGRLLRQSLEKNGVYHFEDAYGGMHRITLKPPHIKKVVAPKTYVVPFYIPRIEDAAAHSTDAEFTTKDAQDNGIDMETLYRRATSYIYSRNIGIKNNLKDERRRFHIHWMPWSNKTKFTVSFYNRPMKHD